MSAVDSDPHPRRSLRRLRFASRTLGEGIAQVLRGSWRPEPPPFNGSHELLETIHERLQVTGAAGLAWWRLRDSAHASTSVGRALHDTFRIQTLDALRHEELLRTALDLLESADIRPILAKGWAMARMYPRAGMRPYGDFDVFVDPDSFAAAAAALARHTGSPLNVDLHPGAPRPGVSWNSVLQRARAVPFGTRTLRVFGPEDHLGFLSSHLLSHGAWRPLWLCDIALLVESQSRELDWDYFLGSPGRQLEEVRVAVRLAHEVLGAVIDDTPWAGAEGRIPSWLPAATLAAWSREHYSTTTRILLTEASVGKVLHALRVRWPNPIEVTSRWGAPYNRMPRLPLQLWDAGVRAARALLDAPPHIARRSAVEPEATES